LEQKKKIYTPQQALPKAMRFCAYQERTQQEVREKLSEWGLWGDEAEEIIVRLIQDNFINEERFAKSFAGGKFRLKKWGRIKIEYALKQKGLSAYCIRQGMAEITDEEYQKTLLSLLQKKWAQLGDESDISKKNKLAQYVIGKGYESEVVWATIKNLGV
jgi:regulatory protein